jgi:prepilin-type N-terminal cleavage/methylation domain-containing protein
MTQMRTKEGQRGMTIIEVLVVAGIISLLAGIAGIMVSRFNASRSINDIARNISSTLQMAKLKSARDGVEYRAIFSRCDSINDDDPNCKFCESDADYTDFATGDDTLTITLERGNSNRGSNKWCIVSSETKKMSNNFNLNMTDMGETNPLRCGFSPKGFMVDQNGERVTTDPAPDADEQTVSMLVTPTATSRINTCGIVELSPSLGRISVVRGNWDGTDCNPIREPSPTAPP